MKNSLKQLILLIMRTAQVCPTCATYTNALCVIYDGELLSNINVSPLDNLEEILVNINDNLVPIHGVTSPTISATYLGQIYINTATDEVFIAIATGGGPADWTMVSVEAAPVTPGIDDVLAEGQSFSANRVMDVSTYNFVVETDTYSNLFYINDSGITSIGDINNNVNGTNITVDDSTEEVNITANNWATINGNNIAVSVNGTLADTSGNVTLSSPYKVYTAVISQSGATAPTVDYLLQNTLSGTPTWGYNNVGQYTLTLPTQWVNNKTIVFINPGYIPQGFTIGWQRSSSSILIIDVRDSAGVYTDALLFKASIEVRVYN